MKFLTVDFGSTYTKLTAIDSQTSSILTTASAFTTIQTNIMDGYQSAIKKIENQIGVIQYDRILCCSSAGGGLKMVALGLVPNLTSKAALMAASSAGAKVMKTYAFEISKKEEKEIEEIDPDLILLCGGTDGGNKDVIIENAKRLAQLKGDFSIIVAGNKSASDEVKEIFDLSDKDFVITENVMPTFNTLNIEPAKTEIRNLFIRKIIDAKGLTHAQEMADNEIIPTPLAVLNACELLSKGTDNTKGLGEFMAIDLGGATTDVYSMATGKPSVDHVIIKGLPETFNKRTVEGDLGMRYSLTSFTNTVDNKLLEKHDIDKTFIDEWIAKCTDKPDTIAFDKKETALEQYLAHKAVEIATDRHCGSLEKIYSPMGEVYTLEGKDLSTIKHIIGIGGVIINSNNPKYILDGAKYNIQKHGKMKPQNPKYLLDQKYIFASMGLLLAEDAELALQLMKKEIIPIK